MQGLQILSLVRDVLHAAAKRNKRGKLPRCVTLCYQGTLLWRWELTSDKHHAELLTTLLYSHGWPSSSQLDFLFQSFFKKGKKIRIIQRGTNSLFSPGLERWPMEISDRWWWFLWLLAVLTSTVCLVSCSDEGSRCNYQTCDVWH